MLENVMLLYQSPDSSQVNNSSERLWQWPKCKIANEIFPNLEALKATLNCLFLSKLKEFFVSLIRR